MCLIVMRKVLGIHIYTVTWRSIWTFKVASLYSGWKQRYKLLSKTKVELIIYQCCLANLKKSFIQINLLWHKSYLHYPRILNFQPASLLWLFQPSNNFDLKKNALWAFNIWFGTKAAKIGDFVHLNFTFGYQNMSK